MNVSKAIKNAPTAWKVVFFFCILAWLACIVLWIVAPVMGLNKEWLWVTCSVGVFVVCAFLCIGFFINVRRNEVATKRQRSDLTAMLATR